MASSQWCEIHCRAALQTAVGNKAARAAWATNQPIVDFEVENVPSATLGIALFRQVLLGDSVPTIQVL